MTQQEIETGNPYIAAFKENGLELMKLISKITQDIELSLPEGHSVSRFIEAVQSALINDPKLMRCSSDSFYDAVIDAADLGLEPNTSCKQGYLIADYDGETDTYECRFQIGCNGLIDLAHRQGLQSCQAHIVYENDTFTCEYGMAPRLRHIPTLSDRGKPVAVYAVWQAHQSSGFKMMSAGEVSKQMPQYTKKFEGADLQIGWKEMTKNMVIVEALKDFKKLGTGFSG